MGFIDRPRQARKGNAFDALIQRFTYLQGHLQFARSPDFARTHEHRNTLMYLGVDIDDALTLPERTEI